MPKLLARYNNALDTQALSADREQEKAVHSLQRLLCEVKGQARTSFLSFLTKKKADVKGVYLYGGVGRGKSMLMDLFFAELPQDVLSRRVHFHQFMIETHDWLHSRRGKDMDDLLPAYAKYVAEQVDVLCFDEFHVNDVADAMILGRLFTHLFDRGLVLVATSNWSPARLYEGGLQRDLFLPFIALLQERMEVVHLDSQTDYREQGAEDTTCIYFTPDDKKTQRAINSLFESFLAGQKATKQSVEVKGRVIKVSKAGSGVALFDFKKLCEEPLAAEDYLKLSAVYHTIFVQHVPVMGQDKRNALKRFILLIDCVYEAGGLLVIGAQEEITSLYSGVDHQFEFQRSISRLNEMRSKDYMHAHKKLRTEQSGKA